jgi:AcrR family transcriptional regulator
MYLEAPCIMLMGDEMARAKKRLTREESQAVTRTRLINSAATVFARDGFTGAAVEDIAELAGFSRGAFYSNFRNKDELFLALLEQTMESQAAETVNAITMQASPHEILSRLRDSFVKFGNPDRNAALLIAEAQLYAIRNPRFRSRLAALFQQQYDQFARLVGSLFAQLPPAERPLAGHAALIAIALRQGLTLRNLVDPKTFPDELIAEALGFIFDKLVSVPGSTPNRPAPTSKLPHDRGPSA